MSNLNYSEEQFSKTHMGYFIRPIVLEEMKEQNCLYDTLKEYDNNTNKPFGTRWIHKAINRTFCGLYHNKYKIEDLFFRGLGHIISSCNPEILNKYFIVYSREGGDIYDRIYELSSTTEHIEYEVISKKHKKYGFSTKYCQIKQESLDNMYNDLYTSYLIECKGWANEEEDFKKCCKEQLKMFLNSGLRYWEYH
tara:strand:+ start:2051 stop:2632 length:582 start_codon:yes stop_codon:yes gene_type:complete